MGRWPGELYIEALVLLHKDLVTRQCDLVVVQEFFAVTYGVLAII